MFDLVRKIFLINILRNHNRKGMKTVKKKKIIILFLTKVVTSGHGQ